MLGLGALLALFDDRSVVEYFTFIYEHYRARMFAGANAVLHDPARAEDAVQEVFLKLAEGGEKRVRTLMEYGHGDREAGFLTRMARQRAINMVRSSAWAHEIPAEAFCEECMAPDFRIWEDTEDRTVVWETLGKMAPDYREILLMLYNEDFTPEQTMTLLGMDKRTFYRKKNRARARLRQLLGEAEGRA